MTCPNCANELHSRYLANGVFWICPECKGAMIGSGLLAACAVQDFMPPLWNQFRTEGTQAVKNCPSCKKSMRALNAQLENTAVELDACLLCYVLWFDYGELSEEKLKSAEQLPKDEIQLEAYRSIWAQPISPQQRCAMFLTHLSMLF